MIRFSCCELLDGPAWLPAPASVCVWPPPVAVAVAVAADDEEEEDGGRGIYGGRHSMDSQMDFQVWVGLELSNRLKDMLKPIQIGLTGSIGMGKSTVASHFRYLGFPVFDADATVHKLYSVGGRAIPFIQTHFPEAVVDSCVDRTALGKYVLADKESLDRLESIVHPLVVEERARFFEDACERGLLAVVYDIPLLFENRSRYDIDYSIVVTASLDTQRKRVLQRVGMSLEKFESILAKQMPDAAKREAADFVVNTDYPGYTQAKAQVAQVIGQILERSAANLTQWLARPLRYPRRDSQDALRFNDYFDAIVFDLDDTLVPARPPIAAAIEQLHVDVTRLMPRAAAVILRNIREEMAREVQEDPLVAHDLTEIRATALRRLSAPYGEDVHVETVMENFVSVRSDVEKFLYSDSLPCLRMLSLEENIPLAVLSNGNAVIKTDPDATGELGRLLCKSVTARDIGAMKPSFLCYLTLAQMFDSHPCRMLYVGDSLKENIVGAKGVGMHCAWLRRHADNNQCDENSANSPHIVLNSLFPSEFKEKIEVYIRQRIIGR